MIYGLYLSAQGAQAQSARLDVIANNLANASTTSFKRDLAVFQSHPPYDVEHGSPGDGPEGWDNHNGGVSLAGVKTDFSNGPLLKTDGPYDVALTGQGFFQVTDDREQFLTRNGQFTVNEEGELVNDTGLHVLTDAGGTILVPGNAISFEAGADGTLSAVLDDGSRTSLGRLAVVQPASLDSLEKVGDSLYRSRTTVAPAGPQTMVRQGYLEGSGANSVSDMLEMIQATRAFETNVNMIKHQDEALSRLLQTAGSR
ncbi:MAG: flagellar hook-basal body protein [Planctomycetaceae bacterium]